MPPSTQQLSDEDLAGRAKHRDMAAFEELVRRYEKRVYGFLFRRTSDRQLAEDLTQDTFVRAFRKMDRYKPKYAFKTWIFTIATRQAASYFRAAAREVPLAPLEAGLTYPAETSGMRDSAEAVWETARAVLPPDQTSALLLKYGEAMSVKEIAVAMKKSPTNVKVLLHRARKRLAAALQEPQRHLSLSTEARPCAANVTN